MNATGLRDNPGSVATPIGVMLPVLMLAVFTACSLVVIVAQAAVFSLVRPEFTRWLVAPALGVLAMGLFAVPLAGSFALMLVVTGGVALLAVWPSLRLPGWLRRADDKSAALVSLPHGITEPFKPFGGTR